jgi:CBS domain containing-hemolysin-like protein
MALSLVILIIIVWTALVLVAGMRPVVSRLSTFELNRRIGSGDHTSKAIAKHQSHILDIVSLLRIKSSLLLILLSFLLLTSWPGEFGWAIGFLIAIIIAATYGAVAQSPFVLKRSQHLYQIIEPTLIRIIEKFPRLFIVLRGVPDDYMQTKHELGSRAELEKLVSDSHNLLSTNEKMLITHSLEFDSRHVDSVMTPRSVITTISKSEFLGPLILDELHKTGHSRLPVIDSDIDHVIGILQLQSLLALDNKRSVTAEKAMEPRVFYIREDQTLQHALSAFLRTHHHLFIVINQYRETVGLLTLEDVIEALLGRKIIDEFDSHEDIRVVALRNPYDNNEPHNHRDV